MTNYTVRWEIDIEVDDPEVAAEQAWEVLKEQYNDATILDVYTGEKHIASFDMGEEYVETV